ncbi:Sds23p [Maudiozyma barnettii]|uniref:Similar to Saccharomyces cerevisiae YGL056C SDS23 One of two Saccharomyces cerevisiae homologs (Sds23p and Sds24p) of the S. pombe Sds23 protein, which is implicated in APC/cyclosome regulation n=1 Tax=Maudiozyma barnettii TaxID=61262 RepID=A0A8H2ZJC1_9SACH|nr:Sds23p [Kazachstania barnettii]CAB4255843.1 similar to Saccharomyces cerevisiae YGL056C SDS23 One of two Saccharomyces cerevisiae homologs (Sds23p and Sds24p) of the S. pombe Sds23 protein, which is implicated in APC/cyclosome regulation [Kazachstania barnettii]
MPTSNDNSLFADQNITNSKKLPTSIVELLSTPPLLPRNITSATNNSTTTTELTRSETNDSSSSSISNLSSTLSKSDSQTSLTSLPMIQPTPSQGLYSVHTTKWQHIRLSQLIESNKLISIQSDLDVEHAFNTLIQYHLSSLPVQQRPNDRCNYLTFDYNDLNFYLLLVLNKININDLKLTKECQNGGNVPVGDLIKRTPKDPFFKLAETDNLSNAINILGSGVHRIAITDVTMTTIKGILSQRRLVKYLWDNARSFIDLEPLFNSSIKDLNIGVLNYGQGQAGQSTINNSNNDSSNNNSKSRVISVNGNQPLIDALLKMYNERISSIAVVDDQYNLIGNISVTDVKHVTRTSQYPLLNNTCRHFISVILNTRGLENGGKDSFPIFHVYPTSSLARTIAKLVATKSHRLWIVQRPSSSTTPSTTSSSSSLASMNSITSSEKILKKPLVGSTNSSADTFDSAMGYMEKDHLAGKLIGVVSLTDILGALARNQTHHKQIDPQFARKHRSNQA